MSTTYNTTFTIGGDLRINRMGYGAMRITGKGIWGPPADREEAIRVLKRTAELGINFIDTADSYGPDVSEELIAEALFPYADDLVIATKGGFMRSGPNQWTPNGDPKHLKEVLEGSLKRLKLERIDLYQLHRIDAKVPAEETFAFLKQAQQEGKIRHIGLSEVTVDQIKHAQDFFDVVSVQNKYSVDNRDWESVLDYTAEQGIAFIPWNPLNAGNVAALEKLQKISEKVGATVHQVALSWLLHRSENILLIPGTSSVKHLEENIATLDVQFTDGQLEELDNLSTALKSE